jgi:streptogramin lyase
MAVFGGITEYPVTTANARPAGITVGPDGYLWFTEEASDRIGKISVGGAVTEYPVPFGEPREIVAGPDGNLWFTNHGSGKIGRITVSGAVTEFTVQTPGNTLEGIVAGADGNLWYTDYWANAIGRITTAGVVLPAFPIPTPYSGASGLAVGPDGNLWFTEFVSGLIGRITYGGAITEYSVGITPYSYDLSGGIAAGPDGDIWFSLSNSNRIGRMTTSGILTRYPLPSGDYGPGGINSGPDCSLWFGVGGTPSAPQGRVGRIAPTGAAQDFGTPSGNAPSDLTVGPDQRVWFTEFYGNNVAAIDAGAGARIAGTGQSLAPFEGAGFSGMVASFIDGDGNSDPQGYTASIVWGDGTSSAGTLSAKGGSIDVSGSHAYSEEGHFDVTVRIVDSQDGCALDMVSSAIVSDADLAGSGYGIDLKRGKVVGGPVATFSDADPFGTLTDYSAIVSWGDGTTSPATVAGNGPFTVSANHRYRNRTPSTIEVTIRDKGGSVTTIASTLSQ